MRERKTDWQIKKVEMELDLLRDSVCVSLWK